MMKEDIIPLTQEICENKPQSMKRRITFYAPKTVLDVIEQVIIERKDISITDAVCQIIIEYGSQKQLRRVEGLIHEKFANALEEINELKSENEALRDRLSLVESKCASVNRAVAEIKTNYDRD